MIDKIQVCALRLEANNKVGLGHFYRMLSLAREFKHYVFVGSKQTCKCLSQLGIPNDRLIKTDSSNTNWVTSRPEITHIIVDILYSDNSYKAGQEISALVKTERHVTVIDSMPPDNFNIQADCDFKPNLLVTPYLGSEKLYDSAPAIKWVSGTKYVILNHKYATAHLSALDSYPTSHRILVTCGGADPTSLTLRILKSLQLKKLKTDVVIGAMFSTELVNEIRAIGRNFSNLTIHQNPTDLIELYLQSSLIIGRPGLIRYEAACLGRPSIFLADNDDYKEYFKNFSATGIAEFYFSTASGNEESFFQKIGNLHIASVQQQTFKINKVGLNLIDGKGAKHVFEAMQKN